MQPECCAQSNDGSLSGFDCFLFIKATLPSVKSEMNRKNILKKRRIAREQKQSTGMKQYLH